MLPDAGRSATSADSVRVERDGEGQRRLVTRRPIAAGDEILEIVGVRRASPTRYSIQLGLSVHLDGMGPVDATNHDCDPSAFIDFRDPDRIVLRALRDLPVGGEVSIHYCATEWDMAAPFDCRCGAAACVGRVRGYRHLSEAEARRVDEHLGPALREMRDADRA